MACRTSAPGAALFWDMLALLAREPGMEWLRLSLAGLAAPPGTPPDGECGPSARLGLRAQAAGFAGMCRENSPSWAGK